MSLKGFIIEISTFKNLTKAFMQELNDTFDTLLIYSKLIRDWK